MITRGGSRRASAPPSRLRAGRTRTSRCASPCTGRRRARWPDRGRRPPADRGSTRHMSRTCVAARRFGRQEPAVEIASRRSQRRGTSRGPRGRPRSSTARSTARSRRRCRAAIRRRPPPDPAPRGPAIPCAVPRHPAWTAATAPPGCAIRIGTQSAAFTATATSVRVVIAASADGSGSPAGSAAASTRKARQPCTWSSRHSDGAGTPSQRRRRPRRRPAPAPRPGSRSRIGEAMAAERGERRARQHPAPRRPLPRERRGRIGRPAPDGVPG